MKCDHRRHFTNAEEQDHNAHIAGIPTDTLYDLKRKIFLYHIAEKQSDNAKLINAKSRLRRINSSIPIDCRAGFFAESKFFGISLWLDIVFL